MAATTQAWQLKGQYLETCNCDYLCPCITSNLAAAPSRGSCTFAMVFRVDQGRYGQTSLDGLHFAVVGQSPGAMVEGNWSVGLILDERADSEQQQALTAIVSGQAGGPMAAAAPLIGEFKGVERAPITLQHDGLNWSSLIPGLIDQAAEGVPGASPNEPLYLDNTLHPASARLALARASRSHVNAFGLRFDDDSGRNNGHYAPFDWANS
jgi:hypothetical protein